MFLHKKLGLILLYVFFESEAGEVVIKRNFCFYCKLTAAANVRVFASVYSLPTGI